MSNNDNLKLWDRVKTPRGEIKSNVFNGRNVTTVSGQSTIKTATEEFGIMGVGWGVHISEDVIDEGAPLLVDGKVVGFEKVHKLRGYVWYRLDGKMCNTSHQYGHTKFVSIDSYGRFKTEEDYAKKSVTDLIGKCLASIGFNADIYMGEFDNPQYAKEHENQIEDKKSEAKTERAQGLTDYIDESIKAYQHIPNLAVLNIQHKERLAKVKRDALLVGVNPVTAGERLTDAFKNRRQELSNKQDLVCISCGNQFVGEEGTGCSECSGETTLLK